MNEELETIDKVIKWVKYEIKHSDRCIAFLPDGTLRKLSGSTPNKCTCIKGIIIQSLNRLLNQNDQQQNNIKTTTKKDFN